MSHYEAGRRAEDAAATFLQYKGCDILARNWRTRHCEIDIIAMREGRVYFCEVKYRLHARQGTGLDYITAKKLRQMHFAAELWLARYDWRGESELRAIEVSGADYRVTGVVTDL